MIVYTLPTVSNVSEARLAADGPYLCSIMRSELVLRLEPTIRADSSTPL